jgi:hypothetical protein
MAKTISGKVAKIPSTQVSPDRYDFIELAETEPDLGVPSTDGYVLSSNTDGTRSWVNNSGIASTDGLAEGTQHLYFTTSRVSYTHTQGVASATWTINHNLHFQPNVTVQDSAGNIVEGEIAYNTLDSLVVTFSTAFSGEAYLS